MTRTVPGATLSPRCRRSPTPRRRSAGWTPNCPTCPQPFTRPPPRAIRRPGCSPTPCAATPGCRKNTVDWTALGQGALAAARAAAQPRAEGAVHNLVGIAHTQQSRPDTAIAHFEQLPRPRRGCRLAGGRRHRAHQPQHGHPDQRPTAAQRRSLGTGHGTRPAGRPAGRTSGGPRQPRQRPARPGPSGRVARLFPAGGASPGGPGQPAQPVAPAGQPRPDPAPPRRPRRRDAPPSDRADDGQGVGRPGR